MLEKINHIAIAVPDLKSAALFYQTVLKAKVSDIVEQPDHGVSTVFVECNNTKIELLQPLGINSPIEGFLKKNPSGGIHHICFEVEDIEKSIAHLQKNNMRILGDGKPKIGAHGKPVVFLHPKDAYGTLIELEEC